MLDYEDRKILYQNFISHFSLMDKDVETIVNSAVAKSFKKDTMVYAKDNCCGYIIVKSGILRAYISSDNFKEITVFRLKAGEKCVLCSSCTISSFTTEFNLQIEEDTKIILIPIRVYEKLRDKYPSIMNHTLKLISDRFADVVNVMEQALFLPLADRIRIFLSENSENMCVKITHEQLANHLGSAREAVSRVLKEMEKSGEISQKRGIIILNNNANVTLSQL